MKKISFFLLFFCAFFLLRNAFNVEAAQYSLQAKVKVGGSWVSLPTPIYFTDFYPGVWNEYDLSQHPNLNLGNLIWEIPNQTPGEYFVGPYSSTNFSNPTTIKRRLLMMKKAGISPMIHIMAKHIIAKEGNEYVLKDYNDYGVQREGNFYYSYDIYNYLLKPILNELKIPYILVYDLWFFSYIAPNDIPPNTFRKLWWQEMENLILNTDFSDDKNGNNLHIRFREYTSNINAYWPGVLLLGLNVARNSNNVCDPNNIRYQFFQAAGNPDGTGVNPNSGKWIGLNQYFWFVWFSFTPDIRRCLGSHGSWNIVNMNWSQQLTQAEEENNWVENYEAEHGSLGPRYFYGYFPHFHDKRNVADGRHFNLSGTNDERIFLQQKAREKGIVFVGYWNEYAESVLEPSNPVGNPADEHSPWINNQPTRLINFINNKIPVELPLELATPLLPGDVDLNGEINGKDAKIIFSLYRASSWPSNLAPDQDKDNRVTLLDFGYVFRNWEM